MSPPVSPQTSTRRKMVRSVMGSLFATVRDEAARCPQESCHPAHRRRHWLCAEAGVSVDRDTARRLFTLIYALLMRNADLTDLGRRPQASSDETIVKLTGLAMPGTHHVIAPARQLTQLSSIRTNEEEARNARSQGKHSQSVINDDQDAAADDRQNHMLADGGLVAFLVGINCDAELPSMVSGGVTATPRTSRVV